MEKFDLPYTIKPKIFNKGFFIVIAFFITFSIFTFITYKDFFVTSMLICALTLITIFIVLYMKRIIILGEKSLSYKGILTNVNIRYAEIYNLDFAIGKIQGNNTYFLIIKASTDLLIKNIQLYKKEDIDFLLNLIANRNINLSCKEIVPILDKIKWVK